MIRKILFMFSVFIWGCSNLNEPGQNNDLRDTEIRYKKAGGWIDTSILNISASGSVTAYLRSHSTLDTIKTGSTYLNNEDRDEIISDFNSFGKYESYYEPSQWYTDGNYHTIILIKNGISDTVTVYEPQNSILPDGLTEIISEMEDLWIETIEISDVNIK